MDTMEASSRGRDGFAENAQAAAAGPPCGTDAGKRVEGGDVRLLPLPLETVLPMLELLDAKSLANFRRSAKLGCLAHEAHVAELRAHVLELLTSTKFPFTHAAYVLGLNGSYYSYDTVAEDHYGIPEILPSMICRLFRLAVPKVLFTTIRIQKLAAAANFGGKHRTLAFSLATPSQESREAQAADSAGGPELDPGEEDPLESSGYVLCLGDGCQGGRGEVCEELPNGEWRLLATPSHAARWVPFPRRGWLQWHWPKRGDLYTITITCEPPLNHGRLTRRERRRMVATGFLMPDRQDGKGDDDTSSDTDACGNAGVEGADTSPAQGRPQSPVRRSHAARGAAKRILGFAEADTPSVSEVEAAFRQAVRVAHPDRARDGGGGGRGGGGGGGYGGGSGALAARTQNWAVSQLKWARRVLRDAAILSADDTIADDEEATAPQQDFLMLNAPN